MKVYVCFVLFMTMMLTASVDAMDVSALSACVIESTTGKALYEKNAEKQSPMASTTKIMTAIVALENSNNDDIVNVSRNAARQEGSSAYLREGDNIRMEDLLYGLMLNSGNDAAVAIAEHISGSTEEFAHKMNETAKKIGAENTSFVNPNGLYDEKHYTTAEDLAKITAYAMTNSSFRKIVSSKTKNASVVNTGVKMYFKNHNKLLSIYDGAIGVKTGFTKKSGRCLVSAAQKDGVEMIAVTLDAPNDWNDHKNLLDYGFSKTSTILLIEKNQEICVRQVDKCKVKILCSEDIIVPYFGSKGDYTVITHISDKLKPPLNYGEKVGVCDITYKGKIIKQTELISDTAVYKKENKSIMDFFKNILRKL